MSHMTTHPMPEDCIETDEPKVFTWCNIPLFTWEGWDIVDTDTLIFYNCKWYSKNVMEAVEQYYMGHPNIPEKDKSIYTTIYIDGRIQIDVIGEYHKKDGCSDYHTIYDGIVSDMEYVSIQLEEHWKNMDAII